VNPRRIASVLIAAAATAAVVWAYVAHGMRDRRGPPATVALQDGATIDFSNGSPVVGSSAADKAALDAGVKAIDEATKNVTFRAEPTPTK
jgi:hypothetical protein